MTETQLNHRKIGIIADDFTGAMDSGAQFVGSKYRGNQKNWQVCFRLANEPFADVEIINTASREKPLEEAVTAVSLAAKVLQGRLLFKKIDSTMRGHVAAEALAILRTTGQSKAVICPAAPLQGRVLIDGVVKVNTVPLHLTTFKDDPAYPASTSLISELISETSTHIRLYDVRQGVSAVCGLIRKAKTPLVSCDAETVDDLNIVAQACIDINALPCGAFGLANALVLAENGVKTSESSHPNGSAMIPSLVIIGSANQVARSQVQTLAQKKGVIVITLPEKPDDLTRSRVEQAIKKGLVVVLCAQSSETIRTSDWLNFSETISNFSASLLTTYQPASLFVVGGETVTFLCRKLRIESIELLGEFAPGIPYGVLRGGPMNGTLLITKAGGFGKDTSLVDVLFREED